ncbi:glycosyltransferase family protein [Rhizobium leguminosarum]|uniref:glycosyltransferase family protein n=1 Tax=Rhizobium leguminosarum TaxID=384 RepID=UPI00143F8375|nr:glycosyltransferase [Rhizobium leguminosarum]NKK62336.1 glycosyl transferase [Rhizobium leguminosarum bv. viciae]NKL04394.1 glycosyl transferase [Rhizobium leguminosarum bv. viciae]NKL82830.1 glycosyl transferase [Rhizobium leguminosarum bv. viciae]NKL89558.1 glycosyl transferase [Rhizobium leguminosarum bv. viciae]NKM90525.1 glycosyl transferase [Rhizobium leguminosarum bv. viciae]
MTAPRIFFYVQHLLGIGHIARASRIANALVKDGFDVTVVTGGLPVPGFPGEGVKTVALPAVVASNAGFSGLADAEGRPAGEDFLHARRLLLLDAFHAVRPDVVIIEAFPFGRRQMRFELLPLLEAIEKAEPRPKLLSSVRDILQENRKAGRDAETVTLVKDHFDAVLVHGDPGFVRLEDTFPLTPEIADRLRYTGLVTAPPAPEPAETFDIIASAGGGAVGAALIGAAKEAAALLPADLRWLLVAGPNLPEADFAALAEDAAANVTLVRFRKDFPSLLRGAKVSISQAGYNTVGDLLRTECRAILIPFVAGGETEQTVRAERLQALGLADILPENGLTSGHVKEAVEKALATQPRGRVLLDLEGAEKTALIIRSMIAESLA